MTRREFAGISMAGLVATRLNGWEAGSTDLVAHIDPLIGASTSRALGEGKTFPGPTMPFGMVQLGPDTVTGGDNAPGYSYEHTTIEGFSFNRLSGVGWYGDFGNLQVMPTSGPFKVIPGRADHPGEGWRSRFRHATEVAECGFYGVTLDDYGIRAEMTVAACAGILQFTFPESEEVRIQINLARRIGGVSTRQFVRVADAHAIEGWIACPEQGGGWGNGDGHVSYKLYFRMEFSVPLKEFGVWSIPVPDDFNAPGNELIADRYQSDAFCRLAARAEVLEGCGEKEGSYLGFYLGFKSGTREKVLLKTGISHVDLEGARNNLRREIVGWDFERVRQGCRRKWLDALECVGVEGGTETQRRILATALYHAMIDPRKISDEDGRYVAADGSICREDSYHYRTIFSGWDVFRAEYPLLLLLNPQVVNDEVNSLLEIAERSGRGYLERWEIMNAYSGCMDGDPATAVILDAYRKGIRKFDLQKAYKACRQTADARGEQTNRQENGFYLVHGYVPEDLSWTMDNAYFDWCVSQFALEIGKAEDHALFSERAGNYRKVWDPGVRSMRARMRDGQWMEWKGNLEFGQGCTESNPLQQTWFVPHDVYGLMELMGKDEFTSTLEEMLENTPQSFGWNPYYNHSNEPVHHVPYLFVYAGKPWLTQKWVRRILDGAYGARVDGICGNDDVGQMSAWYVFGAMGFYPVCPGDSTYILGAPIFTEITLRLDQDWYTGREFTITADCPSSRNCFVQSIRLNGKPLNRCWITHDEIVRGGRLEFALGPKPNLGWSDESIQLPPNPMRSRR